MSQQVIQRAVHVTFNIHTQPSNTSRTRNATGTTTDSSDYSGSHTQNSDLCSSPGALSILSLRLAGLLAVPKEMVGSQCGEVAGAASGAVKKTVGQPQRAQVGLMWQKYWNCCAGWR